MSLTSRILLNSRHTRKDGSKTIIIRLTLDRKSFEISTGYNIGPQYWNEKKSEVKPSCPTIKNVTRLNKILRQMRFEFEDKIIAMQDSGEIQTMTIAHVKNKLLNKKPQNGVLSYSQSIIDELIQSKRHGNARVYKTAHNSLKSFLKEKDIPLRTIDFKFLKKYEAWYLSKGNKINGLRVHMRTLRALLNRAIKEGVLSKEHYAFDHYTIKSEKSVKRAITYEDIQRLKNFEPQTAQQHRAKDYFFMSFYLMGASFIDLAYLKIKSIVNERIEYRRRKTGQLHSIKITPPLRTLLDKYSVGKSKNDFILNVIKSSDEAKQYTQVRDELRRYNRRLKEIGELCEIDQPLTSYVSRHSYATIAKFKDVPVSVISQALGHQDVKTTEIYLANFGNEVMDKYNDLIIGDD